MDFSGIIQVLSENAPKIFMGIGIVTGIGAVVECGRKAPRAVDIINEHKQNITDIHNAKNKIGREVKYHDGHTEVYTQEMYRQDIFIEYRNFIWAMVKTFGFAVILEAASIACYLRAFCLISAQLHEATIALAAMSEAYKRLEDGVRNKYGDEVLHDIKYGVKQEEIEEKDENGKSKKHKENVYNIDNISRDPYAILIDASCPMYDPNETIFMAEIKNAQDIGERKLENDGHVWAYDLAAKILNIPEDHISPSLKRGGWWKGAVGSDNRINLRPRRIKFRKAMTPERYAKGIADVLQDGYLLEFNCDGDLAGHLEEKGFGTLKRLGVTDIAPALS